MTYKRTVWRWKSLLHRTTVRVTATNAVLKEPWEVQADLPTWMQIESPLALPCPARFCNYVVSHY